MPKPYDAALKDLITSYPADWLRPLGLAAAGPVAVLSPDLSAVTAAADTLLRTGDAVVHIDAESGPDEHLARRLLLYNVLAHHRTGLPVHTAVVLLRPTADRRDLDGRLRYAVQGESGHVDFRFQVLRVWETPAEEWLAGGPGLLPLTVLGRPPAGRTRRQAMPDLVTRMNRRAVESVERAAAEKLIRAASILAGLYMTKQEVLDYFDRIDPLRETPVYQGIYERGEQAGQLKTARELLVSVGTAKFGEPTAAQRGRLDAIDDLDRLKRLSVRLLKVESWDALLRGR